MHADSALAVVPEGMRPHVTARKRPLADERAGFTWGDGSRPSWDEPGLSVRGLDPHRFERLAVPGADLLCDRLSDQDEPRFAMPTGLIERLEHLVGQEQQYRGQAHVVQDRCCRAADLYGD